MCTTVKPLGPGPAAYMLPQLIGHPNHDLRRQRLPQYSFGVKKNLKDANLGPGPGAYTILGSVTRNGIAKSPAYSLGHRIIDRARDTRPGPGAHNNHLCKVFQGNRPPAYSIGRRTFLKSKDLKPAPNAYLGKISFVRPKAPAYSMGQRVGLKLKLTSPGPAAYGETKSCINLPCPPKYSITKRRAPITAKLVTPGPNNYNLQPFQPGRRGAKYSFGIRHSQYAPPMIVDCDN